MSARTTNKRSPPPLTDKEYEDLARYFHEALGLFFGPGKQALLASRLGPRLARLGISTYAKYLRRIERPEEIEERLTAFDLVTTHETWFFREIAHFDHLRSHLAEWTRPRAIRIWDAACSSGEEVYSLAITLAEILGLHTNRWELVASDISRSCLTTARRGVYPMKVAEHIPQRLLQNFCQKGVRSQAGQFRVTPELIRHVAFMLINLAEPLPPMPSYDVIFLRNALMYMHPDVRSQVVDSAASRMLAGGTLYISHTESLQGISQRFKLIRAGIYRLES